MKISTLAALLAIFLIPLDAAAHGTERHYGDSLEPRPVIPPPAPTFSLMLIEGSFRAISRAIDAGERGDVAERLDRIRESARALLVSTRVPHDSEPTPFLTFAEAVSEHAASLEKAAKRAQWGKARRELNSLESTYLESKALFATLNESS